MLITTHLEVNLEQQKLRNVVYAVQNDCNTRAVALSLFSGGSKWTPPDGTTAAVSFGKPDGKGGLYDTLPDGNTKAVTITENVVTAVLAPQVLSCPGRVDMSIALYDSDLNRLGLFPFPVFVSKDPSNGGTVSNNYFYLSTFAAVNEAIGNLKDLKTLTKDSLVGAINELVAAGGGTITEDQIQTAVNNYLEKHPAGSTPLDTTLSKEGYAADAKATGEAISKLSTQNLDLTFHDGKLYITVNGVRTGNGVVIGTVGETVYHSIVLKLTNCVSSNDAVRVEEHGAYTTVISAKNGFIMNDLSVTMGGESLTPENGTVHIEDVTGEIQITASAIANTGGVDLSGIVAWYQTDVQDAYNYVAAMDADKWVHHVVLADTHYGFSQYGNSMEIVTALMNTGRFDKFIHLGDLTDVTNDNNWRAVIEDGYGYHNGNMLFVYGNHDNNVSSDTLTTDIYKTALLSNGDFTWYDGVEYCYYYDDAPRKIRYVCLNLWAGATGITAQITWLNDLLAEMTADWTVLVLIHGESTNSNFYNGLIFSDVNVGGIIEGHWHVDRLFNPQNVPRVRLLCDRGSDPQAESGEEHFAPTERVRGTNSEHAITIMSINPTERQVKFYRIGAYAAYYDSVFPNILEYTYDAGDSVYWNEGYWSADGKVLTDTSNYKYETQLREFGTNKTLYVYCSSGENALSDVKVAAFASKNANSFSKRLNTSIDKIEDALSCKFAYFTNTDSDVFVSVSCDGWSTGEYTVADNPDDFQHLFGDAPTLWQAGYIGSSGEKAAPDSDTVAYSNTIKVKPNTTYKLASTSDALTWYGIGLYSAPIKEGFISRVSTATFTTPENCKYVILSAVGVLGNEDTITFEEVTV